MERRRRSRVSHHYSGSASSSASALAGSAESCVGANSASAPTGSADGERDGLPRTVDQLVDELEHDLQVQQDVGDKPPGNFGRHAHSATWEALRKRNPGLVNKIGSDGRKRRKEIAEAKRAERKAQETWRIL